MNARAAAAAGSMAALVNRTIGLCIRQLPFPGLRIVFFVDL